MGNWELKIENWLRSIRMLTFNFDFLILNFQFLI